MRSLQIFSIENRIVRTMAASSLAIALQNLPSVIKNPKPPIEASRESVRHLAVACYLMGRES